MKNVQYCFVGKVFIFCFFLLFCACNPAAEKKQPEENIIDSGYTRMDSVQDTMIIDIPTEDTLREKSKPGNQSVQAYDKLYFGMGKSEVGTWNATRQKIGHYQYNFSYSYNGDGALYQISIHSDPEKTLYYEQRLQPKYANLCRVIAEKYGKKSACGLLPSIFDVMNASSYKMVGWQEGEKKIELYLRFVSLDVYKVECRITHASMEKAENERLYRLKNKNIIESSEKF